KAKVEQTIQDQERTIRALSTPIIDVWDRILTLPVIGEVDARRSAEMTNRILRRIVTSNAACVIIDVTGVETIDTPTAEHLVKMVRAMRLLGTYCVVTGVSGEVARTLVQSSIELGDVRTLRSLKEGLRECFSYLRREESMAAD